LLYHSLPLNLNSRPTPTTINALRVLAYLKSTLNYGIVIQCPGPEAHDRFFTKDEIDTVGYRFG